MGWRWVSGGTDGVGGASAWFGSATALAEIWGKEKIRAISYYFFGYFFGARAGGAEGAVLSAKVVWYFCVASPRSTEREPRTCVHTSFFSVMYDTAAPRFFKCSKNALLLRQSWTW